MLALGVPVFDFEAVSGALTGDFSKLSAGLGGTLLFSDTCFFDDFLSSAFLYVSDVRNRG